MNELPKKIKEILQELVSQCEKCFDKDYDSFKEQKIDSCLSKIMVNIQKRGGE